VEINSLSEKRLPQGLLKKGTGTSPHLKLPNETTDRSEPAPFSTG
jgi:hypothetical protein